MRGRFVLPLPARAGARCRSSRSILPTPRTTTTPSTLNSILTPRTRAASSSPSRSPTSPLTFNLAWRWIEKRSSAATRSISPIASCRCCRSGSPTTSARCARTRTGRRSHCGWSSGPTGARARTSRRDNTPEPPVNRVPKPLYAAHSVIRIERERRNPLDLDLPERKLVLDSEGRLKDVRWPERLEAHRLIEEFMILANVAAAESLEEAHSPLLYRAHDAPSVEKLDDLIEFLRTIGVKLAKGERVG